MIDLNKATMGQVVGEVNNLLSLLPDDVGYKYYGLREYYPDEAPAMVMLLGNKIYHDKVKYGEAVVTEDKPKHERVELKAQLSDLHNIDLRIEELASEMERLERMKITIMSRPSRVIQPSVG